MVEVPDESVGESESFDVVVLSDSIDTSCIAFGLNNENREDIPRLRKG